MDKLLYISMTGAKQNMLGVAISANNLANTKTIGFKADYEQARAMQAFGEGLPSRVFALEERPGTRMIEGALMTTGNDLDIAITGNGWLTTEDAQGDEAYTREGKLKISATGQLTTSRGHPVVGLGGPIIVPMPIDGIRIGPDGAVEIRPRGAPANFKEVVDTIKLIETPDMKALHKGNDGLFRPTKGTDINDLCGFCDASPNVRVVSGALEMSNVNAVDEMVNLINHQRQFELQVKMMKTAETNDEAQTQLLRIV